MCISISPAGSNTQATIWHVPSPTIRLPMPMAFRWLFAKIAGSQKPAINAANETSALHKLFYGNEEKFFEHLFATYYAPLCKSVYNIVKDTDAAEDIVQDVFIKVWRGRATLDLTQSVRAYLFRACMNTALNYLEKHKKHVSIDGETSYETTYHSRQTEETLDFQEVSGKVQEAVDALPPKCKLVFSMSRYEDMSYAAIAESLDISVKAVEKHMSKALKALRLHLKDYFTYNINQ